MKDSENWHCAASEYLKIDIALQGKVLELDIAMKEKSRNLILRSGDFFWKYTLHCAVAEIFTIEIPPQVIFFYIASVETVGN